MMSERGSSKLRVGAIPCRRSGRIIAGLATTQVEVASMSGGIAGGIAEAWDGETSPRS